jgi:quinol monooxygenase YgiN
MNIRRFGSRRQGLALPRVVIGVQLHVVTEVSALVPADRVAEIVPAFEALVRGPLPDGLLRTELLSSPAGEWRIHSLWRDQAALDAMRASSEPPAAPALFRRLGAEPTLRVHTVQSAYPGF